MNHNFNFYLPTKVLAGAGQINTLSEQVKEYGKDVLLITPKSLKHINSMVISKLNSSSIQLSIEEIEDGEPTIDFINTMAKRLRGNSYDIIIGFGGGSTIDVAKSLSIALTHSCLLYTSDAADE